MILALLTAILPSLGDSLIKGLFGLLTTEMNKRNLLAQGMAQQAAAETAKTAVTIAQEAKAEAQVDKTATGMEDAARKGNF